MSLRNGPRTARPINLTRPGAAQSWYRISNRAPVDAATSEADVYLMDEIGGWGVTAGEFIDALRAVDAQRINLHINSPGGDVFDGVAIYNALVAHSARITVYVDGLAASAASFIAQAGDEVVMNRGSMMMIHDASGFCFGPATDMRAMADLLDKVSDTIAGIYESRTGKPADGWRAAMLATTWYTAREAVDAGLADRVTDDEDKEATATARAWAMTVFNRRPDTPPVPAPRAQEDPAPAPAAPASPVDLPTVGADADQQEGDGDAATNDDAAEATDDAAVTAAGCGCDCEACEDCTASGDDSDDEETEDSAESADQPEDTADAPEPTGTATAPAAPAADEPLALGATQTPGAATAPVAPPAPTPDDPWGDLVARLVAPASPRTADDVLASLREALL